MEMEYIIIGSGVGGITAAEKIRQQDAGGRITLISEEPQPFYSRIRLTDFLARKVDESGLLLKRESWYAENRIDLLLQSRVTRVDAAMKKVRLADGRFFSYDRLLLATGGSAFVPPVPGADRQGVFTLRSLEDARAIRASAAGGRRVLLMGGGVLGLEAGNALRQIGCEVTVVECFDRLLPRQMDAAGSELLQRQLAAKGMTFFLAATVTEILGGPDQVTAVRLADGRHLPCDLIIVSAGMRPRSELARNLGLDAAKGVEVDDRMATAVQDVFGAGDLVRHRGINYGTWEAARNQGEVAGLNMAGAHAEFTGLVPGNVLRVAEIETAALGEIDVQGRHRAIVYRDPERFLYRKLVLSKQRLIGAILYGDIRPRRQIARAIDRRVRLTPGMQEELERGNLTVLQP